MSTNPINTQWLEETRQPLAGDWAARPTSRVILHNGHSAILVETTPDHDPKTLQGHKIADFVRIANFLRERGLRVPEIYEANSNQGILLVEDFGDDSWARILSVCHPDENRDLDSSLRWNDEIGFYDAAVVLLKQLWTISTTGFDLPHFTNSYIFGRTVWYLDEYKKNIDPHKRRAFIQIWDGLMQYAHHDTPDCFVHGDFHPGNLMRLADGRIGLLDFGGASFGNGHYDLVNLLEDIRRTVPDDIKIKVKNTYAVDEDLYAIFHAQFYMRLLGQMTRRGMVITKNIPLTLESLIHRHAVLAPLKPFTQDL